MAHTLLEALLTGRDAAGNYLVQTKSSSGDYWNYSVLWKDGSGGTCSCRGFQNYGHCTIVDGATDLLIAFTLEEASLVLEESIGALRTQLHERYPGYLHIRRVHANVRRRARALVATRARCRRVVHQHRAQVQARRRTTPV